MNVFKKLMNVLGIIAASVFSILLVIILIMMPVLSSIGVFFEGENIHKLISDIDFAKVIESEMGTIELSGETDKEAQIIDDLMESEMMKDVATLCVEHLLEEVDNAGEVRIVTAEDISDIANEHMDELQQIVKKNLGEDIPLTEEVLDEMTNSLVKEYSAEVANMIPTVEDIGLDKETLNVLNNFKSGTYFWMMFGVAAVLTIIVMLCQVMRFKGFMWIGVDYLVSAIGSLVLAFLLKSGNFISKVMIGEMGTSILESSAEIIYSGMLKGSAILAGCGIIFIVIFVVGRKFIKKENI